MMPNQKKMRVTVDGKSYDVVVELIGDVFPQGASASVPVTSSAPRPSAPVAAPKPASAPVARAAGAITSPLAGTVITVHVKEGAKVASGDTLVTLEAMKMNTAIRATGAGTVKSIHCEAGNTVEEGAVLVVVE